MQEIIFWGATGQAKVLRECLKDSGLTLAALFDNNKNVTPPFADVPLYFGRQGLAEWQQGRSSAQKVGCLVAIGGDKGKDRIEIQEHLEGCGLVPIVVQHPTAYAAENAKIGSGSQILTQHWALERF